MRCETLYTPFLVHEFCIVSSETSVMLGQASHIVLPSSLVATELLRPVLLSCAHLAEVGEQ